MSYILFSYTVKYADMVEKLKSGLCLPLGRKTEYFLRPMVGGFKRHDANVYSYLVFMVTNNESFQLGMGNFGDRS
jgi:hypothetical protein